MAEQRIPLLAVVGPTASGKTALAVELALRWGGEVVSADSMQIYQGMDIATAKPDTAEKKGVPHHMMDFLPPDVSYSVADYVRDAQKCIKDLTRRMVLPIVAGGTGLYIDSLLRNIRFTDLPANPAVRTALEQQAETQGNASLLRELAAVDPDTAGRLHVNDRRRIVRALEVFRTSGVTMTEYNRRSRMQPTPYRVFWIGLQTRNREALYRRIDERVDRMIAQGLVEEARAFWHQNPSATSIQAIGYKELIPFFSGQKTLEESVADIKRETRRYAKRQLSWFRRNEEIHWFYPDEYPAFDRLFSDVCNMIEESCDFIGDRRPSQKE